MTLYGDHVAFGKLYPVHGLSSVATCGDGCANPLGDQNFLDAMPHSSPPLTSDRLRGRDKGRTAARIGIVLILLSGMLWFSLFAIPFLPLTVGQKAVLAAAMFVGVQIAWWSGAMLVGPQTIARLWSWCGRKKRTEGP